MVQLRVHLQSTNNNNSLNHQSTPAAAAANSQHSLLSKPPFPPTTAVAIANRGAVDGAGGDGVARGSSVVSPLNGIQEHGQGLQKKKTEVTAAAMTSLSSSCSSSSACNDVTLTSNDAAWFVESWIVEYAIAYQHMSVVNKVIQYRMSEMQELCNGNQSESPSPIDLEVAALEQCNLHSTFILFHLVNRAVFSLQPPQYDDDDDPTLHAHPYMPGGRSGTCKGLYRRASQSLETLLSRFSGQIRSRAIVYIHVLCIQEVIHEDEMSDEQLKKLIVKILQPKSKSNCDVMCKVRDNCVAVVQSRAREGGERARGIDKIVQLILEGDRAQGDHFNGRAELLNQWAKSMRNIREKIGTTILERMNVFGLNTVLGFVPQLRDLPVVQQVARHVNISAPDQQMRISAPCLHSFLDTFLYSPHSLFTQPQPHPPQPPPQTPQQTTPPSPPPPHSPQAVPLEQRCEAAAVEGVCEKDGERTGNKIGMSDALSPTDGKEEEQQLEQPMEQNEGPSSDAQHTGAALSTTEGGTEKKEEKKETECVGTSERSNTSSAATTPYASSPRGAGAVGASISLEQFSQQHHLRLDIVTEEPLPPPPNKKKSPQQQQKKKKLHTDDTSAQAVQVEDAGVLSGSVQRDLPPPTFHFNVSSPSSSGEETSFASDHSSCHSAHKARSSADGEREKEAKTLGAAHHGQEEENKLAWSRVKFLRLTDDHFEKDFGRVCVQLNSQGLQLLGVDLTSQLAQSLLTTPTPPHKTCTCCVCCRHCNISPSHHPNLNAQELERQQEEAERQQQVVKNLEEAQKFIFTALQSVTPSKNPPPQNADATNRSTVGDTTGEKSSRKRRIQEEDDDQRSPTGSSGKGENVLDATESWTEAKKPKMRQEKGREKKREMSDSEETELGGGRSENGPENGATGNPPDTLIEPGALVVATGALVEEQPALGCPAVQKSAAEGEEESRCNDNLSQIDWSSRGGAKQGTNSEQAEAQTENDDIGGDQDWWPLLCESTAEDTQMLRHSDTQRTSELPPQVIAEEEENEELGICEGVESPATIDIEALHMSPPPPATSGQTAPGEEEEEERDAATDAIKQGTRGLESPSSTTSESQENKQPPQLASICDSEQQPQQQRLTSNSSLVYIRPKHEMMERMKKTLLEQEVGDGSCGSAVGGGPVVCEESHVLRPSNAVRINWEQHRMSTHKVLAEEKPPPPLETTAAPAGAKMDPSTQMGTEGDCAEVASKAIRIGGSPGGRSKGGQSGGAAAGGKNKYKLGNPGNSMSKLLYDLNDKRLNKRAKGGRGDRGHTKLPEVMFHPLLAKPPSPRSLWGASGVSTTAEDDKTNKAAKGASVKSSSCSSRVSSALSTICFNSSQLASGAACSPDWEKPPFSASTPTHVASSAHEEDGNGDGIDTGRPRIELSDISCFLAPSDDEDPLLDDSFNANVPVPIVTTRSNEPPQSAVSSQSQSEKQPPPPPRPPNKSSNKRSHRRPKGKYAFGSSSSSAAACSVGPRNKEDVDILGSGFRIALPVLYFPKGQLSMDYSEWRLKQAQFERTFAGSGGDSQSEERRGDSKHDDDAYLNGFSVHTPPSFCPTESLAKAALGFSSSPEAQLQSSSGGESFRTCASEVVSTNGVDGGENSSELQPSQEESVGEPEETIQTSLDAFQGHCHTTAGPKGRTRGVTDTESRLSRKVLKAEDKQLLIHLPSPVANPSEEEARSPSPPCRNGGGGGGATEPMAADYLVSEETCFSKKSALVFIRPRNNATSL